MTVTQGLLLDTNAISETQKAKPHPAVLRLFQITPASQLYLSVLTLGELRRGVAMKRRRHPEMTDRYSSWIHSIEQNHTDRILPVDKVIATLWGQLTADRSRPVVDTLLAATAIAHELTLVTRNVKDLAGLPIRLLNPWADSSIG